MANDLDCHHFPVLTDSYVSRAEYKRFCPHCGAPENVIETAPYSRSTIHCPICGWSTRIKGKKEPLRRVTDEVRRRSDDSGEADEPRTTRKEFTNVRRWGPEMRAANEDKLCCRCGCNNRTGFSVYCAPCQRQNFKEANQRAMLRIRGLEKPADPAVIDELAFELTEYMKTEAVA